MSSHGLFDRLIERCTAMAPQRIAVAFPTTAVALGAVHELARKKWLEAVLVGPRAVIMALAKTHSLDIDRFEIVEARDEREAAAKAVALCKNDRADFLMKGSLHTDVLMRAVLARDTGLRGTRRVSHAFVLDAPAYPRPLIITDAAINIRPTLDEKVDIARNAIDLAHALGIDKPNLAVLSAVETVNANLTSTIDAAALSKMAERNQIVGATIDGPLAFDTAVSAEAARLKDLTSSVAGRADIVLVPDLESGNMLAKQLEYLGDAELAGVVLGARIPIVLTSRADAARARLASCAIAMLYANHMRSLIPV
ncbi:MAG: bifunctional enoyl-CoA hydratase/phosphate acetyltransferase [Polyangiaceae bacterium]